MIGKVMRGRTTKVLVAAALVGTVLAVGTSSPISAAPQVKDLPAGCKGADPKTDGYLGALGGAPSLPITVTSDVPATLEPEQNGSPIAFTIDVNLNTALVDTAAGFGIASLDIKNTKIDITAGGPGLEAPIVIEGRPGPATLALVKGQPAGVKQGPFTGTLDGVKKGGLIKYTLTQLAFTITTPASTPAIGSVDLNLLCSAPGTAAITNIPIPGAPVIQQPIAVNANANEKVLVDVLGDFTTPGVTEDGRTLDVDPNSLKVLEGPGTVENGQVAITAGESSSVLVEVCATETLPGTQEVQRLVLDPTGDLFKRGIAFTLAQNGATSTPVDLLSIPIFNPADASATDPSVWKKNVGNYGLAWPLFQLPTTAELKTAIETIPGIGAGGVEVFTTDQSDPENLGNPLPKGTYDIKFSAQADVSQLSSPNWWSIFPQEVLAELLALAGSIGGGDDGGEGGGTPSPIPEGLTAKQYYEQLRAEAEDAWEAGNGALWGEKVQTIFSILPNLILESVLENIDEILAFINSLFTKKPVLETTVGGEAPFPICTQAVVDVTVASVEGTGTTPTDVSGISATNSGASLAFAG